MSERSTAYLMYHELRIPGRKLFRADEGYTRYVVAKSDFGAQLARLKEIGMRGVSVGEALANSNQVEPRVAITFDDGCETDLLGAAPLLKEAGIGATFYVVAGWIGKPGFLSEVQLLELAGLNFEIGCHSMTHLYLTDLTPDQLRKEMVEVKERLEQSMGRRIEHFSCPGGRWNRRVAQVAREAGYRSVVTSRIGANSTTTDPFRLARLAIMRGTTIPEFDRLCQGRGLLKRRAKAAALRTLKGLLGNKTYERIRSAAMN